jgi:hypothetical protein
MISFCLCQTRVEPVLEACAWSSCGALVALASVSAVAVYRVVAQDGGRVRCETLHLWRVDDDGGGTIDCLSFAGSDKTVIASLTSGAVYRLRPDSSAAECLRRSSALPSIWLPARTRALGDRLLATVSMDGHLRVADEKDEAVLEFALADDAFVFAFLTSRVLRFGDDLTVTACGSNGDTWFVDTKGNVLLFSPLSGQVLVKKIFLFVCFLFFFFEQDPSTASVVAFDIHKSRATGESFIVYLQGNGEVALFSLDLTCLECRLFSKHAESFVQRHPVFSSLNAKQRSELVRLAMLFVP